MKEVGGRKRFHEVTYDDTPIDLHAADIEDRLAREGRLTLRQLIVGRRSRSEMIGVFLALLELIREKKILVQQDEALGDMEITPAPEEHRRTFRGASLHLATEDEELEAGDIASNSAESVESVDAPPHLVGNPSPSRRKADASSRRCLLHRSRARLVGALR
jgi:chromatin segregation and condensation protein Rec8/ScpA/Scc1 (kleisin family)